MKEETEYISMIDLAVDAMIWALIDSELEKDNLDMLKDWKEFKDKLWS